MTSIGDYYFEKTNRRHVFNIMPLTNIYSVVGNGILCYEMAKGIHHFSVAMEEVQSKRNNVKVPNGLPLHQYASLYFDYKNPMMYKRRNEAEILCVLAVGTAVFDIDGCVVSDGNAASPYTRFYTPLEGIDQIDFRLVFAKDWNSPDRYEKMHRKAVKCAEVLVPRKIPYEYITGACVLDEDRKEMLLKSGFTRSIIVKPETFFR